MSKEEIAKAEYHLKHMPMSALRRRIETLSHAVIAMREYLKIGIDRKVEETFNTATGILADLTEEYCDIVECTEICNVDDIPELEARRDE